MADNNKVLYALINNGSLPFLSQADVRQNNDSLYSLFDTKVKRDVLISALVELIALQSINKAMFENPLKKFKIDPMEYGKTEEEIFVNLVDGRDYDFYGLDVNELYRIYKDNTMSVFHEVNARKQFPTTVSYDELRASFMSANGLQSLIDAKISVLYDSAELWEYLRTKLLLTSAITSGFMYPQTVAPITDKNSAEDFLTYVRAFVEGAKYPNRLLNYAGSDSTARPEGMTLFVTPLTKARLDVKTLASVFNLPQAEVTSKIEVVDSFDNPDVVAVLIDDRFLHIRQNLSEMTNNFNAVNMSWNYFYNLWEMFSISPFRSAIVFTTKQVGGTDTSTASVEIDNATVNALTGAQVTIVADITDTNTDLYVPQILDYNITSTVNSPKTMIIPGSNILLIGDDETADTIKVTVSNRMNDEVKADATITVVAR